eukprot:PhF_6_TR5541/c0_g1_i1/m.7880
MSGPPPAEEPPIIVHPSLRHFLYGQYGNLFKFALWWCALAPLTYSLLKTDEAIGVGRIVYNSALCVLSPIGGIVAERVAPRKLLMSTTMGRFTIWCILLPLLWWGMDKEWFGSNTSTFAYVALNVMLFFDGVSVGFGCILDIDICGLDTMGAHHHIDIDDNLRNYFNTRNETFFAICFVILSPAMAVIGYFAREGLKGQPFWDNCEATSAIMVGIFVAGFLVATIVSMYHYLRIPGKPDPLALAAMEGQGLIQDSAPPPATSTWGACMEAFGGLGEALTLIWRNGCIKWRLVFLALEIALEDAIIVVVAACITLHAPYFGNEDAVLANCWSAGLIACGKLGGVIASFIMMHYFQPPSDIQGYRRLFYFVFFGAISTIGFPLSHMISADKTYQNLGIALVFLTFFLFFFFSTLPKIGFMCLLQNLASQIEGGGRIFGFIAILVTIIDALVIMGMSVVFRVYDVQTALWISFGIYAGHGVFELIVGPTLILQPLEHGLSTEGGDVPGNKSLPDLSDPKAVAAASEPILSTGTYSNTAATTEDATRVHTIAIGGTGPGARVGSYRPRSPSNLGKSPSNLGGVGGIPEPSPNRYVRRASGFQGGSYRARGLSSTPQGGGLN